MNCFEDLKWRGLVKDISSPELENKLNNEKVTFYIGTDPTADSMHIGHFSSFLIATRLARYGHKPILLVGGATGLIGDPKPSQERQMITKEEVMHNVEGLTNQAKKIFGFEVVNNYDWIKDINTIDFLRDYGKYINVNYMLDKDIISRRLDTGITFCEFAYTILQGLDFVHLNEANGVTLQVAGSDQWGNITTGIELIRKIEGKEAYGFTMPLILDATGKKIGKSEGNALWIDKEKTSPFKIYQYFINTDDSLVIHYLKVFTFLSKEEIETLEQSLKTEPEKRLAQKALAYEIIKDLHGVEEADKAKKESEDIFSSRGMTESTETIEVNSELNISIVDFLMLTEMFPSKSEARRMVEQNAISINSEKINDPKTIIDSSFIKDGGILVQKGKKQFKKVVIK